MWTGLWIGLGLELRLRLRPRLGLVWWQGVWAGPRGGAAVRAWVVARVVGLVFAEEGWALGMGRDSAGVWVGCDLGFVWGQGRGRGLVCQ